MKPPSFTLSHVHMDIFSLTYSDEFGTSSAPAEKSPDPDIGLLVWKESWHDHPKGAEHVAARLREWAAQSGLKIYITAARR
jgi:hypothetical protein